MDKDSQQSTGVTTFLGVLLAIHVLCWIASVIKAVIDRKAIKRKIKATKSEPLLAAIRRNEEEETSKQTLKLEVNTDDSSAKFALQKPRSQPNSPVGSSNAIEHYFPKWPKQHLSTGGARRIGPEELAIMLDNYAAQQESKSVRINDPNAIPPPTRLVTKGITTANV